MLASTGKFAEAIELAEAQGKAATTDASKQQWMEIKHSLKLSGGLLLRVPTVVRMPAILCAVLWI